MIRRIWVLLTPFLLLVVASCRNGQTEKQELEADSTEFADSMMQDTLSDFEEKVEELRLPEGRIEVFSDFIFTFINNRRFQAERVKFPLPLEEQDGSLREITSGRDFRADFQWPSREEYTMLLTDAQQMEDYQNDMELSSVEAQIINLRGPLIKGFQFRRDGGRWQLLRRRQYVPKGRMADFLRFYNRFSADSIFRQESLAEQVRYATADPDGDMERVEGTLLPDQWSAFSPELPHSTITNINFGQSLENADQIVLLQCGTSSGMMDTYTFRYERGGWKLVSYEN